MLWRRESPWHLQRNSNRPGVRVRVGESEHECDEHRLGAYAVACGAAGRVGGVSKTWNETERLAAEGWIQGRAQEGARAEESDPARGGGSTEVRSQTWLSHGPGSASAMVGEVGSYRYRSRSQGVGHLQR